jgi:methylmalonic aciduria homocystinuria type C protein
MHDWERAFAAIRDGAAAAGFDLAAAGRVGDYNAVTPEACRLPDHGDARSLAVVVGNTRAMWPRFLAALRAEPERLRARDPLDAWTMASLGPLAGALPWPCAVRYAHEPPPRRVAMQRLAEALGLAALGPSGLCVRDDVGPWFGLRAAFVVAVPAPSARPAPRPCDACDARPCVPALETALKDPRADWRTWVAVRAACPVGASAVYDGVQTRYHYEKDRAWLAASLASADPERRA